MCNALDLQTFNLFNQTLEQNSSSLLEPYATGTINPIVIEEGLMLCSFDLLPKETLCLCNEFDQPLFMFATFTKGGIDYEHHDFQLKQTFQTNRLYSVLLNRENGKSYYEKNRQARSFNLILSPSFLQKEFKISEHPLSHLLEKLEQKPLFEILKELPLSHKSLFTIEALSHLNPDDPMSLFLLKSKVYELLYEWLTPFCQNETKPYTLPEIERFYTHNVALYIHEHFLETLSLERLCKIAKTNASKLQRNFKYLFGQSLFSYISACRLEYAKTLLEKGEMDLTDISKAIGYAHQSNFSTAFTKFFGYSPKNVLKHKAFY